eukprot:897836-Pleurochrysis_carterae.AAC.3
MRAALAAAAGRLAAARPRAAPLLVTRRRQRSRGAARNHPPAGGRAADDARAPPSMRLLVGAGAHRPGGCTGSRSFRSSLADALRHFVISGTATSTSRCAGAYRLLQTLSVPHSRHWSLRPSMLECLSRARIFAGQSAAPAGAVCAGHWRSAARRQAWACAARSACQEHWRRHCRGGHAALAGSGDARSVGAA